MKAFETKSSTTPLTKPQAKKLIKDSLTPKYNQSRDAKIIYLIDLKDKISKAMNRNSEARKQLHRKEITQDEAKAIVSNTRSEYSEASKKDIGLACDYNKAQLKEKISKLYNENLKALVEKIYSDIKALSPKGINLVEVSEHDIELLLTLKNENRSYTINTIVAGGYNIQCLHYRTTYKLHKGVL